MEALEKQWVMACVDGSEISNAVVDYSAWIAQKVNSPLELVHSIEHSQLLDHTDHSGNLTPNTSDTLAKTLSEDERLESKRLIEAGKHILEKAIERIANHSIKEVKSKQRHGGITETLTDLEAEIRVLVLGLRGEGHDDSKKGVGSHLESSIRALHRPIFIVSESFKEPKSIMLAFNDTEAAHKALEMVCKSPLYQSMEIHLVHVSHDQEKGKSLVNKAEQALKSSNLNYQIALLNGDAQTQLLAYQDRHNIDITMMGAFNHGKLRNLFFGSFTLKMLQHNKKPILLIR
jgi:nucleotide-binding universal stress UspA family protein